MTNKKKISFIIGLTTLVFFILLINHTMNRCGREPFQFYIESDLGKAILGTSASNKFDYNKVKHLIENGADVNKKEGNGVTPLHIISHYFFKCSGDYDDCINIFTLLIKSGADVNAQDDDGKTPLHHTRNIICMDLLIEAGADVNLRDDEGRTPIFKHVSFYHKGSTTYAIELLLKHGARIDIKDNEGRSPLSIARDWDSVEVLKLFKKYGKIE